MNRQRHTPTKAKQARALGPARPDRFEMPPKSPLCGKRRCRDEGHAVTYILWLARKSKDPLRAYDCPKCGGWHVTKRPVWEGPTS